MIKYYRGGYYLIKKQPISFGSDKGKVVSTCSNCINISVFNQWCVSWGNNTIAEKERIKLGLTSEKIIDIQRWTDSRFDLITNVFPNLEMALEFKELFFNGRQDIEVYSLNFPSTDADLLGEAFLEQNNKEFNYNNGNFLLRLNLMKKEEELNEGEEFIGYDLIGVECDGSFHSFYCHDITNSLIENFGLSLNENGLFNNISNRTAVRNYLNNDKTGLEPVPWYIVKVKRVKDLNKPKILLN